VLTYSTRRMWFYCLRNVNR